LSDFLRSRGFESAGTQREVLFADGRWHSIESWCLGAPRENG